ncbi:fungal-specific transcription factor domain-containing protein [Aspergillus germanicus]
MSRRKLECRRRTGCFQCKAKHLQCTEEHPRCKRCERLGLACTRGLKLIFREDALQRGISFGREGVWTKQPNPNSRQRRSKSDFRPVPLDSYFNRWEFLNVTFDDLAASAEVDTPHYSTRSNDSSQLLQLSPAFSIYHPLHTFSGSDGYLLDYFIRGISPSCSLSKSHNPYISLVIPLCFVSNTLLNALLAVAANQLRLLGSTRSSHEGCHYKQIALQSLRQEISTGTQDEGTVAAVLMLCFQDISDGCSASWMTHLRGGLQLLECNARQRSPDLWNFFRMYFIAHDIMARTVSDHWDGGNTPQLWLESEDLEEIDVVMGCSRGLMTAINKISILASTKARISRIRPLTPVELHDYENAISELHTSLLTLKQRLPSHSADRHDLERVANIKHLTALLYLHERLGFPKESQPSIYNPSGAPSCLPLDRFTLSKDRLVSTIIESIATLPDMATLLWPLFILGNAGVEDEYHRRFLLDRLSSIQRLRNLGSVRRTIDAVKHAFGTTGLHYGIERAWGHESYRIGPAVSADLREMFSSTFGTKAPVGVVATWSWKPGDSNIHHNSIVKDPESHLSTSVKIAARASADGDG